MRSCPADGQALLEVASGDLAIDVCELCGGKWFDDGELTRLTKQGVRAIAQLDANHPNTTGSVAPPGGKSCPACNDALMGFSFRHTPDLVLEGCKGCKGIWLDAGKLTQLALKLGLPEDQLPAPAMPAEPAAAEEVACPQCGAANKPTDKKCWQCEATLVPDAPSCPRCLEELTAAERDGVAVGLCDSCGGVWMEEPSLMQMFAHHMDTCANLDSGPNRREEDMQARTEAALCPTCKTGMLEHDFIAQLDGMYNVPTGIRADRCSSCNGMWFDVGELTCVQQAVGEYRSGQDDSSAMFAFDSGE